MKEFSQVEQLAIALCREAGSDWDRAGTRKNHWRAKAIKVIEQDDQAVVPNLGAFLFGVGVASVGYAIAWAWVAT